MPDILPDTPPSRPGFCDNARGRARHVQDRAGSISTIAILGAWRERRHVLTRCSSPLKTRYPTYWERFCGGAGYMGRTKEFAWLTAGSNFNDNRASARRRLARHFEGLRLKSWVSRQAVDSRSKLVVMTSLVKKPCLHSSRRNPGRHLAGSSSFSPVILCRLLRHLCAPSDQQSLLPFHLGALSCDRVRGDRILKRIPRRFATVNEQHAAFAAF